MITVDEAQAAVLERVQTLTTEAVSLETAWSRILRANVLSDRDQPPFDRAAMDGFAVRSADTEAAGTRLRIVGEVRAGVWPDRAVGVREAMRIMTGAPAPGGADAVIQVERTKMVDPAPGGAPEVVLETAVTAGQNIVPRGSEARAGSVLLREGTRIGGRDAEKTIVGKKAVLLGRAVEIFGGVSTEGSGTAP